MQNSAGPVIYGNHRCGIKANMKTCIAISILTVLLVGITPHSARATDMDQTKADTTQQDGQPDFDIAVEPSKTHGRRLVNPVTGSNNWPEGTGAVSTRKD